MISASESATLPAADPEDCALLRARLETSIEGDASRAAFVHAQIYAWVAARLAEPPRRRPLVLGLSAPQGAGKSTLAANLVALAGDHGMRALAISIDDFYITRREQIDIAAAHPNHPYLTQRGYPGTHDVALGVRTLDALRDCAQDKTVLVPRYDKSKHGGRGDRAPSGEWTSVRGPLDLVVLEGWMLGFRAPMAAPAPDAWLADIDARLAAYDAWTARLDAFVHLCARDVTQFIAWRSEAEARRQALGLAGLSPQEIARYAQSFLPAYERYVPELVAHPPNVPYLRVNIGKERLP